MLAFVVRMLTLLGGFVSPRVSPVTMEMTDVPKPTRLHEAIRNVDIAAGPVEAARVRKAGSAGELPMPLPYDLVKKR